MLLLRICALAGLLAATLLIVPWVVAGAVQIEYDWVRQDVSDLGADTADHGWIQDAGDMASGFLVVAFAVGLYVMLGDRWSGRIGAILIGIFGLLALLMGAVFDLDCSLADKTCRDAEHSSAHSTHELVSGLAGISALVAPFVLAQRFRRSSDWSDRAAFALLCGVAAVLAFVLYIVFQWKTGGGIAQRLLIVAIAVFVAGVASRLWSLKPGAGLCTSRSMRNLCLAGALQARQAAAAPAGDLFLGSPPVAARGAEHGSRTVHGCMSARRGFAAMAANPRPTTRGARSRSPHRLRRSFGNTGVGHRSTETTTVSSATRSRARRSRAAILARS